MGFVCARKQKQVSVKIVPEIHDVVQRFILIVCNNHVQ